MPGNGPGQGGEIVGVGDDEGRGGRRHDGQGGRRGEGRGGRSHDRQGTFACGGASGREGGLKLRDDVVGNAAEGTRIGGRAGHDKGASFSGWMDGIIYEYGRGKRGGFTEE